MNDKICLDSFAWIEYSLGTDAGQMVNDFLEYGNCITPSIVIAELAFHFQKSNLSDDWETFFKFIKSKSIIVPLDENLAAQSGIQKKKLRILAKDVGLADSIIYQTAIDQKAILVTGDIHFENVPNVLFLKEIKKIEDFLKVLKRKSR